MIKVELGSTDEANQFRSVLTGTRHAFNIFIKLNWHLTRLYMMEMCTGISKTETVALEINGVTPDIQPVDYVSGTVDTFGNSSMGDTELQSLLLLNYQGHSGNACIYTSHRYCRLVDRNSTVVD